MEYGVQYAITWLGAVGCMEYFVQVLRQVHTLVVGQ